MADDWSIVAVPEGKSLFGRYAWLGPGFAVPESIVIDAEHPEGGLSVSVSVSIIDGKAVATSVTFSHPDGVQSADLRSIPLRDLMAAGIRMLLMQAKAGPKAVKMESVPAGDEDAVQVVRKAVGYVQAKRGRS